MSQIKIIRKIEVIIDPDTDVPECYSIYFQKKSRQKPIESSFLFKIVVEKKRGRKMSTTVSWDPKKTNLTKDQIENLKNLQKELGTNATLEKNSMVYFGNFTDFLKDYLVDTFEIAEDKIIIVLPKPSVPPHFNIKIVAKEGDEITTVKWNPVMWQTKAYQQFVDEFRETIVNVFKLPKPDEIERKKKCVFTIRANGITKKLTDYFTNVWLIDPKQIDLIKESLPHEPVITPEIEQSHIKNPLREMIEFFSDFDQSSYYKRMAITIDANCLYEKKRLENLIIRTDLKFKRSGPKNGSDQSGKNAWVTKFNVLKAVSIDGIASGRFLSEGDNVMIRFGNRKRFMKGSIVQVKKGVVTALFKIKYGRVPPGWKHNSQEKEDSGSDEYNDSDYDYDNENNENNDNENEEEEDNNDDDDFDDYYDYYDYDKDEEEDENAESKSDESNDITKNPYSITFQPNDSIYQRCALALLNLYEMPNSPIKKIITGEQISAAANKSNDTEIGDSSFDLTDSEFLSEEDKNNQEFMKFLKFDATFSQTRCVEMILQNNISIVHGPPGCGKTSSISLFVYHLLPKIINDKKRILLCAYSNQAVENIAKFVSPIVKALGKKMVWIARKSIDFETKRDFEEATEEEKNLSIYQILKRNTKEANKFKKLQETKWELFVQMKNYRKAKREKKYYPYDKPRRFSINEQKKMDDLRSQIEQSLVSDADVVCSTLLTSAKMNMVGFKFDYVFIDEASQANQIDSIIPLIHQPSKLVLLGDHKQLDAMIPDVLKNKFNDTMKSLYRKLLKNNIQHEMLNVQFRMNPLISQFPNQEFYKNRIQNAPGMKEKTAVNLVNIPTPIAFIDVKEGKERKVFGTTYRNYKEAEVVERIINNFKKNRIQSKDVGVITPYHGQVHLLRKKINKLDYKGLRISSVDTFQGSERDFIVLSLVRTNKEGKFGFLPDKHRINVSLTRARKGLIIVGNFQAILNSNKNGMNEENEFLINLCKFYKDNNAVYDESDIERIKVLVEKQPKSKVSIKMQPQKLSKKQRKSAKKQTNLPQQQEIETIDDDDDDDDVLENVNDNIKPASNSVEVVQQPIDFEYDVDSDYDENQVTADNDDYYFTSNIDDQNKKK